MQKFARPRQGISAAENHHSGQSFDRSVIAFRIENAKTVAIENELFTQQPRYPALSGLRIPRHQQIPSPDRERQRVSVVGVSEQEMAPRFDGLGNQPFFEKLPDVAGHGGWTITGKNIVGGCLQNLAAPGHRDAHLRGAEQLMVVLSVANRHGVVRRQPEDRKRLAQSGGFADGLGQHHHAAAVEHKHQRQLQPLKDCENPRRRIRAGIEDGLSNGTDDSFAPQFLQENRRRRWRENPRVPAVGKLDHCAVLGHYCVYEVQIARHPAQIRKHTARYQQHHDALGTSLGDGFPHFRIEGIVAGDGAIEIQSQRCEFHVTHLCINTRFPFSGGSG